MRYLFLCLICSLLILDYGCIDCEPRSTLGNNLRIQFFGVKTRFDSIVGLGMRQNLYRDTILTDSAYLFPMNRLTNRSTFLFTQTVKEDSLIIDTLTLGHELITESIPPNCGYVEHLENITLETHSFDSAYVTNSRVQFRDTINVWVRLKDKN